MCGVCESFLCVISFWILLLCGVCVVCVCFAIVCGVCVCGVCMCACVVCVRYLFSVCV